MGEAGVFSVQRSAQCPMMHALDDIAMRRQWQAQEPAQPPAALVPPPSEDEDDEDEEDDSLAAAGAAAAPAAAPPAAAAPVEGALVPPEPPRKSVTYQPEPLSWKPAAVICFLKASAPQAGQAVNTGSEIFCRTSLAWPQASQR